MGSSSKKHKKESKKHKHKNKSRSRSGERIVRRVIVSDDTVQTLRHHRSTNENSSNHGSHHKSRKNRKEVSSESDSDSSIIIVSEHNSRSRSTDKERERDRAREKERYREKEVERERARDRDRERERERQQQERERERDRQQERERERERDYEKRKHQKKHKEHRHHKHRDRSRSETNEHRNRSRLVDDYESDSSDCVEVPLEPPPAPHITQPNGSEKRRRSETPPPAPSPPLVHSPPPPPKVSRVVRSPSPIPENGAGDCLSITETNKLRAKLGLKPLEVDSGPIQKKKEDNDSATKPSEFNSYKDEWGEFVHKPANNLAQKAEAEKLREKIKAAKERRALESKLKKTKTLGESDEEVDDISNWLQRSKKKEEEQVETKKRSKMLEKVDNEFGISNIIEQEKQKSKNKAYRDKDLKGLRVEHDLDEFQEGKTVILTLKDKAVLDEDDDALVNVNMVDDEHYRKNVQNKKLNPLSYGYDVYEEEYDRWGNPIERGVLSKYDEEIDKDFRKKTFRLGDSVEEEIEHRRKLLEIKTKLSGKKLETLQDTALQLARDTYSEVEMTKFKKPKKKIKKLRQKLKVTDLLPLGDSQNPGRDFGSRKYRTNDSLMTDDTQNPNDDLSNLKVEVDDEDDLARCLSKARKLKQQEALITKPLPIDPESIKSEIIEEKVDDDPMTGVKVEGGFITLNATAEFCRTLGDIPTYGMSGNRDEDSNDMMDFDEMDHGNDDLRNIESSSGGLTGTWNSVNPNLNTRGMDLEEDENSNDIKDVAILDEEPDVGSGVAAALRLALSKGYLEKEERNRPSNAKMAHLQAKNYTIDDKSYNEEEKGYSRRDRYHGPISDFKDKDHFKPNVKLEYIDDNGRILNAKEAFRYLSHKFHGKGPGKNKIEKRLKKMEQDGLMKTMSSTDTPLGTLTMLQQKQKETQQPFVVLSGGKQMHQHITPTSISKHNK